MKIISAKDLVVNQKAYSLAMAVFEVTRGFPVEERFAMTGQMRRSARSGCLHLLAAGARRRYEAHFVSKPTDCDGENADTESSLDSARDCGYVTKVRRCDLTALCAEVGKMLGSMIKNPESFLHLDRNE